MATTVQYTLTEETIYHPTAAEWQRIDELAQKGGATYYADIPERDEAFLDHATIVSTQNTEQTTICLTPRTLAFFRRQGQGYQAHISAILDAYVTMKEGEQSQAK